VRFEALTVVKISTLVLWVVTTCGLVDRYQRFEGTYCVCLQERSADDGNSTFIRNVCVCLQVHMESQCRSKISRGF
jgi:hypothetical protein